MLDMGDGSNECGAEQAAIRAPVASPQYVAFAVGALAFGNGVVLASIQILNLVVGPVRASLGLSDLQLSLLQGVAFGIFAALAAIPVARVADSGRRRGVALGGAIVWSIGTFACGSALTFWHMFIGRALVGIGEVCFLPAAISLLNDVVPRQYSALALGIFVSGSTVGSALSWFTGGWIIAHWALLGRLAPPLGHLQAWRAIFFLFAALGCASAALIALLREPPAARRGQPRSVSAELRQAFCFAGRRPNPLARVIAGIVIVDFGGTAVFMWLPSVLVRSFALTYQHVGQLLSVSFLVFCSLGAWLSGAIADWLRSRGRDDAPVLMLLLAALGCTVSLLAMAAESTFGIGVIAALGGALTFSTMGSVMGPLATADVSPPQIRSQILAFEYFLIYLIDIGFAPSAVALLTTYFFHSERDVGWAIAMVNAGATVLAIGVLLFSRKAYALRAIDIRSLAPGAEEAPSV
jgi:MFS family permease